MSDEDDETSPRSRGKSPCGDCPAPGEMVRALVERLRTRRNELAAAVGGKALSVEVVITPAVDEPYRLGFAGEGYVTTLSRSNPLTLGFSPDVVIRGSVSAVVDVLTANEPTPEGVHLADPEVWPRYARVHRVVASELRTML